MNEKDESPEPDGFHEPPRRGSMDLGKVHGSIIREHREPAEGYESVPLWLVGIIMALVFWGGSYLAFYGGGFRSDVFLPREDMASAPVDMNDPAALGQRVFTQNCILCHQANGAGIPGVYPPLAGSEWALGQGGLGDNHLVNIVLLGLEGPVQVGGATFNGAMPGWSFLRDEELAAVLTYIRSQWGNSAPAISADFVRQHRELSSSRREPWTQNELQAIARESAPPTPDARETPILKARQ